MPYGVYLAVTWAAGEAPRLKRWHWLWGTLLALALPGAWLGLAWRQGAPPEYFAAMFGAKSFGRVIHDHHAQPFYYYLSSFPVDFLPWTIFLPAAYKGLGPGWPRRRLLAWGLFVVGLFSLIVGKRNLYILPAFPAAAMLIAAGWDGMAGLSRRWTGITGGLAMGLVGLIGAAEAVAVFHPKTPVPGGVLAPGAVIMVAGAAALIWFFQRERLSARWFGCLAGVLFAHQIALATLVLPAVNPLKAPVELAAEARGRLDPGQPVYVYRDQLAIVALYVGHPGRYLREPEEVEAVVARGGYGVIVFDREDWESMALRFSTRVRARPFKMGGKNLVWIDFPPPAGR